MSLKTLQNIQYLEKYLRRFTLSTGNKRIYGNTRRKLRTYGQEQFLGLLRNQGNQGHQDHLLSLLLIIFINHLLLTTFFQISSNLLQQWPLFPHPPNSRSTPPSCNATLSSKNNPTISSGRLMSSLCSKPTQYLSSLMVAFSIL